MSLAVNYSSTAAFHAAGYSPIQVNSSYVGGQVRQYGNFSFSRVYESGHEVPAYQPETAYQIFRRSLNDLDIATGLVNTATTPNFSTTGPADSWAFKNVDPPDPKATCYLWELTSTCTDEQIDSVLNGTALIHDWVLIDANTSSLFPDLYGANGTNSTGGNGTAKPTATASVPASYTGAAVRVGQMGLWKGSVITVVVWVGAAVAGAGLLL